MTPAANRLGIVTSGSLDSGLDIRLDSAASVEDMAVGRYVTIEGAKRRYFGMITNIGLDVIDPHIAVTPPDVADPFVAEVLAGTSTYGTLHVTPYLTIGGDVTSIVDGPQPVKTVPSHFSTVNLASEQDIELVFGKESKERFWIGNPLDMEVKLCLSMEKLVQRSSGVFGKSGTGKTFFTRMLLVGMLQQSKAVNLIFDMHNEYGWKGNSEAGHDVKGLKQLFPAQVAVFTLDEESNKKRSVQADVVVKIGYDEIEPEDMALLRQTLNLTDQAVEAIYQLRRKFGRHWLERTSELSDPDEIKALLDETKIHEATLQNLQRGLNAIKRHSFLTAHPLDNPVQRILQYLDQGTNVVLEFGRYQDISAYILVANLLTRRIHAQYRERVESESGTPPHPLVITIEEAHRFLNPELAEQTIFGIIAREMRKYNVTLLVIDQRPSGIDEEVMSQIGTKITFLLDNDRDIDSVLAGVSGKSELKSVLAKLASKQQALIFGHAVPMPVTFQPREYGSAESYRGFATSSADVRQADRDTDDLFGEKESRR